MYIVWVGVFCIAGIWRCLLTWQITYVYNKVVYICLSVNGFFSPPTLKSSHQIRLVACKYQITFPYHEN